MARLIVLAIMMFVLSVCLCISGVRTMKLADCEFLSFLAESQVFGALFTFALGLIAIMKIVA